MIFKTQAYKSMQIALAAAICMFVAALLLLALPGRVSATSSVTHMGQASIDAACESLRTATGSGNCTKASADKAAGGLFTRVVDILSMVVGAVSVVMIIIGGFRYVVSNGDSNGLQGAKNTILYAVVGIIVVLFAQVIVRFVTSRAT